MFLFIEDWFIAICAIASFCFPWNVRVALLLHLYLWSIKYTWMMFLKHFNHEHTLDMKLGSLRWAWERQAEVKHTKARLPSVFIHPSSLAGNCKPTLLSSHGKRRCCSFIFLFGSFVLSVFARFIARLLFLHYAVYFWLSFVRKIKLLNVNLVNQLGIVMLFPPKTSAPCARVRNDRNWRKKQGTQSSLPTVMSAVVEQALAQILSWAP